MSFVFKQLQLFPPEIKRKKLRRVRGSQGLRATGSNGVTRYFEQLTFELGFGEACAHC